MRFHLPKICKWSWAPQIRAGANCCHSPSIRQVVTVRRCGAHDHVRLFLLALLPSLLPLLCTCSLPGPPRLVVGSCVDVPDCESIYPQGHWQFVHLIEFKLPNGATGTVIGVTVLNDGSVQSALTTTEGMTLFAADSASGRLKVLQAVPPFDKPGFAKGLMADVRTIFVRPKPVVTTCGLLDGQQPCCRLQDKDGRLTDILPDSKGCWRITSRPAGQDGKIRSITASNCTERQGYRLARSMTMTTSGKHGYTLKMRLISAEKENRSIEETEKGKQSLKKYSNEI